MKSSLKKLLIASGICLLSLGIVVPATLGAVIPSGGALYDGFLSSGITPTSQSMTLTTGSFNDGTALTGWQCFTTDAASPSIEYICGNASGTSVTNLMRGVMYTNPNATSSNLAYTHSRGASVQITDYPDLQILARQLNGIDAINNPLFYGTSVATTTAPSSTANIPNWGQVTNSLNAAAFRGSVPATTSTPGIVLLATTSTLNAGTTSTVITAFTFPVDTYTTLTTGLASYFKMEGNANDSYGLLNGTANNTTFSTGCGKVNSGACFSQAVNSNIALPYNNIGTTLSYSAWVNPTTLTTTPQVILSYMGTAMGIVYDNYYYNGSQFVATPGLFFIPSDSGIGSATSYMVPYNFIPGAWYHVAVSAVGSVVTYYVNGQNINTLTVQTATTTNVSNNIGSLSSNYYFNGNIDELGVWSKALGPTEVSNLYNNGAGETPVGSTVPYTNVVPVGLYGKSYGGTPTVTPIQYNSTLASTTYTFTDTDAIQHTWTIPNLGTNEYIVVTASAGQGGQGGSTSCSSGSVKGAGGGGGGGSTAISNNATYGSGTYNLFVSGGGGSSGDAGGNCVGLVSAAAAGLGGKIANASTTVTGSSTLYYTIGTQGSNGQNNPVSGNASGGSPGNGNVNGTVGGTQSGGVSTSGAGGAGATDTVSGGTGGAAQTYSGNFVQSGNAGSNGTASAGGTFSAGAVGTSTGNGSITVVLYYTQGAESVSSTVAGNNFGGTVTVSATTTHLSPTTSTINFAPWTFQNAPSGVSCVAQTWGSSLAPYTIAENTTSVEFGFSSTIAGNKYDYNCVPR